jgi:CRISPR system Cascade subunit CasB
MTDSTAPTTAEQKAAPVPSWRDRALADARDFVLALEKLRETDRGRTAQLRRNAGETLPGRGTAWFYRYLFSPRRKRYAELHFLVATLFDWNRKAMAPGDLGHAVRRAVSPTNEEALRRRFRILLDSVFDRLHDPLNETAPWQEGGGELAFRLRQMVKLLASKEIGVDWAQLLVDLSEWSQPDKRVQKKWARSFFGPASSFDKASTSEDEQSPMETPTE